MSKNPFLNALGAAIYIFFVVIGMTLVTQPLRNEPDTFFAPVMALFVLTLSVAVMAFIFFYQPLLLLIDGKKKQAVDLFVKTIGIFATFTVVIVMLLSLGVF